MTLSLLVGFLYVFNCIFRTRLQPFAQKELTFRVFVRLLCVSSSFFPLSFAIIGNVLEDDSRSLGSSWKTNLDLGDCLGRRIWIIRIVLEDESRGWGLSCKTNLDHWDCFRRRILIIGIVLGRRIPITVIVLEDGSTSFGWSWKMNLDKWDFLGRRKSIIETDLEDEYVEIILEDECVGSRISIIEIILDRGFRSLRLSWKIQFIGIVWKTDPDLWDCL